MRLLVVALALTLPVEGAFAGQSQVQSRSSERGAASVTARSEGEDRSDALEIERLDPRELEGVAEAESIQSASAELAEDRAAATPTDRAQAIHRREASLRRKAAKEIEKGREKGVPEAVLANIFDGFDAGKFDRFRAPIVPQGEIVDLRSIDPADTGDLREKKAERGAEKDQWKLKKLQNKFYFDGRFAMLAVKNGMDTAGKDSSINHVLHWMNKQGMFVKSWKEPTERERRHAPLWRERRALEQVTKGLIGVFNRSHYENVVVRFISPEDFPDFGPKDVDKLIARIRAWELQLAREGYVVLKFFYHISRPEQKERLERRRAGSQRQQAKFQRSDIENRKKWDAAMDIWGRILAETNTPWAPWFIVPGDKKWFRDYVTGRLWVKRLKALGLKYPKMAPELRKIPIPD